MVRAALLLASLFRATAAEDSGSLLQMPQDTGGLLHLNKNASLLQEGAEASQQFVNRWSFFIPRCMVDCLKSGGDNRVCGLCIRENGIPFKTANGIGVDYLWGMLSLAGRSYTDSFCGGELRGCTEKLGFPGSRGDSIMDYERVKNMARLTPEMEWNGTWWRGGELGFIINNPVFWKGSGINPPSIVLGSTPRQHSVVRPYMEKAFTAETWNRTARSNAFSTVDKMIRDFLEDRKRSGKNIAVPKDLTILVHQILNKVSLKRDVCWQKATEFVELQGKVIALGTITQMIPDWLYQDCHWLNYPCHKVREYLLGIQNQIKEHVDAYEKVWASPPHSLAQELRARDSECKPSDSCMRQLAAATWDALYAAGGLSVPTNLAAGLGVLFSKDESNPFRDRKHTFVPEENAMEFTLEVVRYFPAVVGFPHWETRPTCEGMTEDDTKNLFAPNGATRPCPWDQDGKDGKPKFLNQYQGGHRVVANLALAQRDPAVWGDDAEEFVIRSHDAYKKSVGFAEPAYRPDLVGGAMNRNCPGKTLSLHIVSSFFKQLKLSDWRVDGTGPKITPGPKFVEAFELKPVAPPPTYGYGW